MSDVLRIPLEQEDIWRLRTRMLLLVPYSQPYLVEHGPVQMWHIWNRKLEALQWSGGCYADAMAAYHGMVARWWKRAGAPTVMEAPLCAP